MVVKRRPGPPPRTCAASAVQTERAATTISVWRATRVTQSFYFSHPLSGHDECKGEKQQQARNLGNRGRVVEVREPFSQFLWRVDRAEPQIRLRPVVRPN